MKPDSFRQSALQTYSLRRGRRAFPQEWNPLFGLEDRPVHSGYHWHGLKRGGDASKPYVIFQYSLSGSGRWVDGKGARPVPLGSAFLAVVPSRHEYLVSPGAERWEFFWFIIQDLYAARRIASALKGRDPVVAVPPESRFAARSLWMFDRHARNEFEDAAAFELAQIEWAMELERHFALSQRAGAETALLDRMRTLLVERPDAPPAVESVAAEFGMTRTQFAHYFRRITGRTPAAYLRELRIREAASRLLGTRDKLSAIASDLGFADANHLCKVFARHYAISPGLYRRQFAGTAPPGAS